ncbi:MAG: alginate export family protein [Pseudomonadota bacterium]
METLYKVGLRNRLSFLNRASLLALMVTTMPDAAFANSALKPPTNWNQFANKHAIKSIVDLRHRSEFVDAAEFDETASAHTFRARVGVQFKLHDRIEILVEGEGVANINNQFNSTTNGVLNRPIVADPEEIELNRARAKIALTDDTAITAGRQRINYADQRFVGAVDFRQNQQTFDALRLTAQPVEGVEIDYAYLDRVHRIFGDGNPVGNFRSDSHIGELRYKKGPIDEIVAYGFALDFENAPALSSLTIGARAKHSIPLAEKTSAVVRGEYANQRDYGAATSDFNVDYIAGDVALKRGIFTAKAGYERLGGDGNVGFSTPLATLHKFQGFADRFLTTPVDGIQDVYGMIAAEKQSVGQLKAVGAKVFYHRFDTTTDGQDLGSEVNAIVSAKFNQQLSAEFRGALYRADTFGPPDVHKVWLALRYVL